MENRTMLLNTQLSIASKKFYKSCEQIKVIKQHISELMSMFSYCEQEMSRLSQEQVTQTQTQTQTLIPTTTKKHLSVFRESIRQQIENLQGVKTAYFTYAHRKADEITKLQCELYGEDTVIAAYGNGNVNGYNSSDSDTVIEHSNSPSDDIEIGQDEQTNSSTVNWSANNNQVIEYLTV